MADKTNFDLCVSPAQNLKSHLSSALSEVIRLLESVRQNGDDRLQLDYSLYKLDQVVHLCVCSQDLWGNFVTDEVFQLLLTAHEKLSVENRSDSGQPSCQPVYTGSVGRPALNIPRKGLQLYLRYGFSVATIAEVFRTTTKQSVEESSFTT